MNIGVIGVGSWGKKLIKVFDRLAHIKICACTDLLKNLEWFSNNYPNIKLTDNYKDILSDNSIDAVVIASPNFTHYKFIKESLASNKHVFVEKPMTINSIDAKNLLKITTDRIIFVNHIFLFHPCFDFLKEKIKNEKVKSVNMIWNKFGSFQESIYNNLLSHEISILVALFGSDLNDFKIIKDFNYFTETDFLQISFSINDELHCDISINRLHPIKQKSIFIEMESGDIYCWIDNKIHIINKMSKKCELIFNNNNNDVLKIVSKNFIDSIDNLSKKYVSDANFGLKVVKIIEQVESLNND